MSSSFLEGSKWGGWGEGGGWIIKCGLQIKEKEDEREEERQHVIWRYDFVTRDIQNYKEITILSLYTWKVHYIIPQSFFVSEF